MICIVPIRNGAGEGRFVETRFAECDAECFTRSSASPAIIATTPLESTPPDRKAPSGTSAIKRAFTEAASCCASAA